MAEKREVRAEELRKQNKDERDGQREGQRKEEENEGWKVVRTASIE